MVKNCEDDWQLLKSETLSGYQVEDFTLPVHEFINNPQHFGKNVLRCDSFAVVN